MLTTDCVLLFFNNSEFSTMLKKLLYLALFAVIGITVLVSCEKEDLATQNSIEFDGFSFVDGRLAFDNDASFRKTLDELYLSQDELDNWENGITGYTSMRSQFEEMTDEDAEKLVGKIEENKFIFTLLEEANGDLSMERNLYNDVLATLVNFDGYLQIGDKVYRFTYSHYYSVDVNDMELLKAEEFGNPKVSKTEIKREFVFEDTEQISQRSYTVGECTTTSGKKRVKGLIVREEIFDNDCNITTKHQKKVLGIWWANSTSISVSFSGNFTKLFSSCSPVPHPFFSNSGSSGSSSSITRTVPGNHSSWNGCNGEVTPFHDGVYLSTHIAGGKTCTLSSSPLS